MYNALLTCHFIHSRTKWCGE